MSWRTAAATILAVGILAHCAAPQQGPGPLAADSLAVNLFLDLHLARARQELSMTGPSRDEVLARYSLDSAAFEVLMAFYQRHPDRYAAMTAQVADRLGAQEMRDLRAPRLLP